MPYKKNIYKPSKAELQRLYTDEGLSQRDIAARFGISSRTINSLMKDYGIPARSPSQAMLNREAKKPWITERAARSRQRPRRTQISKLIRSALRPITGYKRVGACCALCGRTENLVLHHTVPLAKLIQDMLDEGHGDAFIAYELSRRHYLGDIELLVLCKDCHCLNHIS